MDEKILADRLRHIEARHAAALPSRGTDSGPCDPAERIRAHVRTLRTREPDVEFSFSVPFPPAQRMLGALCSRYGVRPFRRPRQRASTVCVKAPRSFLTQTFWPLFEALASELDRSLIEATDRVVSDALGVDPATLDEPGKSVDEEP